MKTRLLIAIFLIIVLCFAGCKVVINPEPAKETKSPETTVGSGKAEPESTAPETTENPFDGETEIDFSQFETEPQATEPSETEPPVTEPEETEPAPTEPEKPQPEPTEPEKPQPDPTEPEETEPVVPPTEPDGYNSQIVRP